MIHIIFLFVFFLRQYNNLINEYCTKTERDLKMHADTNAKNAIK